MKPNHRFSTQYDSLYVECVGGAAGDMFLAALLDAGGNRDEIQRAFEQAGLPGLRLNVESVQVEQESALWVRSIAQNVSLPTLDEHGVSMKKVFEVLKRLQMPPEAYAYASRIYRILGQAESEAHRVHFDSVHLHEVGELDSILDIAGVAIAYASLGSPKLYSGELPSGSGKVQTSHGPLECPVPAVVAVSKEFRIPLKPVEVIGETITPTGIAILAGLDCTFLGEDTNCEGPIVGCGAGTKRFSSRPNLLRLREYEA